MLTENEARDILSRAAATIEVQPAEIPFPVRRRSPWLVPAVAAAAVLAAVVAGLLVVQHKGASPSTPVPTPTPVLPKNDGKIPSVFAYDADSAEAMLEGFGLVVTRVPYPSCGTSGRALGTDPRTGIAFKPDDPVKLLVADPTRADCQPDAVKDDTLAWKLLDFANVRGPAPSFASKVDVYLNGHHTELTGAEASSVATWGKGTALGDLARFTRETLPPEAVSSTPDLQTYRTREFDGVCTLLPEHLQGREALEIRLQFDYGDMVPLFSGCHEVLLFTRPDGSIDTIVAGIVSEDAARQALKNGTPDYSPDAAAIDLDPLDVGSRFLAFARGESDSAPVDGSVALFRDGKYQHTISGAQANDRPSFALCAGVSPKECEVSAVAALLKVSGEPQVTTAPRRCTSNGTPLSYRQAGSDRLIVLTVAPHGLCRLSEAVALYYDGSGNVTAVDLLSSSPTYRK